MKKQVDKTKYVFRVVELSYLQNQSAVVIIKCDSKCINKSIKDWIFTICDPMRVFTYKILTPKQISMKTADALVTARKCKIKELQEECDFVLSLIGKSSYPKA